MDFRTNYSRGGPHRNPVYNIAFAEDWQGDGDGLFTIVFVGADETVLMPLFHWLCTAGVAKDYTVEVQHPPRFRHGYVYDRQAVSLVGYNMELISPDSVLLMVEKWLEKNVRHRYIDRYKIDDLLNLQGHLPELMLNKANSKDNKEDEDFMAYIALKVPWYVACHFRGRDENHQLTEFDPVKFTDFDHEYQVMVNNLRNIPEQNQSRICYSQRAWQNILRGKTPDGGSYLLHRNQNEWPTSSETCVLSGVQMSGRHHASDYLLIEMPREVFWGKHLRRTNACYCLSYDTASFFAAMLTDRFCYEYTQWIRQDQRMARSQGFKRKQLESQERYFTQYNFPVIIDDQLRESLRRQHSRLVKKGNMKPQYGLQFNHSFLEHVSEDDEKKIEKNKKKGSDL